MNPSQEIIEKLYQSFSIKDYRRMAECYHPEATFTDSVFNLQSGREIAAMWHMLTDAGKDLRIEYRDIRADSQTGTAHWEAFYTFSKTGRPVHNILEAVFEFKDGLIIRHTDRFDLWRWAGLALGTPGKLLGWAPFFQQRIRTTAMQNLRKFMASHPQYA